MCVINLLGFKKSKDKKNEEETESRYERNKDLKRKRVFHGQNLKRVY